MEREKRLERLGAEMQPADWMVTSESAKSHFAQRASPVAATEKTASEHGWERLDAA